MKSAVVDLTVFKILSCGEGMKSSIKELAKEHGKMCYKTRCLFFQQPQHHICV